MIPRGRSRGQRRGERREFGREKVGKPRLDAIGAILRLGEKRQATRKSRDRSARSCGKSAPARCNCPSAAPSAAQCATVGARVETPSRKVTIAAGLPGERAEQGAVLCFHRLRADKTSRGEMFHQAEEEGQIAGADALLIKRQDEESGSDMQQKIGILDAFGNALIGKQLAELVIGEKAREGRVGNFGIDSHERVRVSE